MDKETFTEIFNRHASTCYALNRYNREEDTKYIYGSVEIGGASGGSCWGGTAQSYSTGRDASDAEVPNFDSLLEEIAPEITFLKYKNLIHQITWQTTDDYSNDYYGNYTEYGYKYITCDQLYNDLINAGII